MRGRIPRGENLGPKSKTYDEIQAEINAEMKRIGKGKWSSTLDELVAQRDRAKASPTKSIEVTGEEAKNPTEQILDAIFGKDKVAGLQAGFNRHYLESPEYTKENSPDSTQEEIDAANERIKRLNDYRTEQYGFDVTNFSPENVAKMVDNMKRHTRASNELAEMVIENYPFGYIKEKVTDGY
jgi:hypothetical protein